jgi:hypothetical protein
MGQQHEYNTNKFACFIGGDDTDFVDEPHCGSK